ncbi:hypothetical protein FDENT_410 [Fusarium denticulatum]|uniref:Uncharacterized protein n=1 Tax=Fusarium denticulatum TaxID=48507 RepID=A0A8H5XKH7_9HYPO|nr:hypothetical protein FDENT_410 [Fusarium denticulatum]
MSSPSPSVSDADSGRSSPDPSLPSQLSLVDCPYKCGLNIFANLAPEIPDNQEDVLSALTESPSDPDGIPPIHFQALRARQYLRKHYSLDKESDYCKVFYRNWETVKHSFSFLIIAANLYKEDECEVNWPLSWNDDSALAFFLDETVASWTVDLRDGEREDVERLSHIMASLTTVDTNDKQALEMYQDQVTDILAGISPVEEVNISGDYDYGLLQSFAS